MEDIAPTPEEYEVAFNQIYEVFREKFGKPKDVYNAGSVECPKCHSRMNTKIQFCKICGAYPI